MPLSITFDAVADWEAVGAQWRELEARAQGSFFQSWSWMGCLAAERFDRAVLMRARQGTRMAALALFNRRTNFLHNILILNETGTPSWDAAFIEYNGILAEPNDDRATIAACLAAAARSHRRNGWSGLLGARLVLNGVDSAHIGMAGALGRVIHAQRRDVPTLDLAALRQAGHRHLDALSANTRSQLRRSLREYTERGPLAVTRADTCESAHAYLDALTRLHQSSWGRRGRPGAFADPVFGRFHHTLIDRCFDRGEVDLLRMTAGPAVIGYLYNFRYRGRAMAYQSGFDYEAAGRHEKPGLTCHHLAIEYALDDGADVYDFLAGGDRYKRSLADGGDTELFWATVALTRLGRRS
jgi:CelD/BcsL family acetyltransferase involved in cellulose biosynthesis